MSSSINGEVCDCEDEYKDWIINIKGDLEPGPECCIYRVPKRIRKVNEEAYTPQVISIGPFHYDKEELEDMEKQKGRYVRAFFKRTTCEKREQVLAFIRDHEQQIRNCYAETCKLQSREYVMMILHDAIFIIELLVRNFEDDTSDLFLSIPAEIIALKLDLQLLENQLPYFLLEGLYKLVVSSPTFIYLCFKFFEDRMFDSVPKETMFKHFTDLRRSATVKSYPKQFEYHVHSDVDLPCAEKLHESGVKFKVVHETDQCLLDIKFEVDELRIPHLRVYDETETILRNIMALEQCYYPDDTPVCDYIELLDSLIDTKSDVDLLVKEGIICNCLGEKTALTSLFSKLRSHMPINKRYYYKIHKALQAYYDVPRNRAMATLKSVYFKDRWRGTATVAAAVGLLLTFISAMNSVQQLIK